MLLNRRDCAHNPNLGPKVEKKQTGVMPMRLKMRATIMASAVPRKKTDLERRPMAKEETTMFAESHCCNLVSMFCALGELSNWSAYHCRNVEQRSRPEFCSFIFWHSLNPSLLDPESACKALDFRIPGVAELEALAWYSAIFPGMYWSI